MVTSLEFNESLRQEWPTGAYVAGTDKSESMIQQFRDFAKQTREFPWYGLFPGTVLPHLCAIYSSRKGDLRLECSPQYELHYDINLTAQEAAIVRDPDFVEPDDDEPEDLSEQPSNSSNDQPEDPGCEKPSNPIDDKPEDLGCEQPGESSDAQPTRHQREVANLLNSSLDGPAWDLTTDPGNRSRRKAADKKPQIDRPPDSGASAATSADGISGRIRRITDAMLLMRAKLASFKLVHANATDVPSYPALGVEIKPTEPNDVTKEGARRAIEKALGQIVQQAQFIFGMWEDLKIIWMLGVCGRWVQFFKFTKARTPLPDPVRICHQEYYQPGPLAVAAVPEDYSEVIHQFTLTIYTIFVISLY